MAKKPKIEQQIDADGTVIDPAQAEAQAQVEDSAAEQAQPAPPSRAMIYAPSKAIAEYIQECVAAMSDEDLTLDNAPLRLQSKAYLEDMARLAGDFESLRDAQQALAGLQHLEQQGFLVVPK